MSNKNVKKGIDCVCDAIRSTLGPGGRNAFIDHEMQPFITNDGVSIARAMKLESKEEQLGVWLVNNTCDKTFDDVGDSTTTTAVLLQAIINEAEQRPENPIKIRKSLKDCGKTVDNFIIKATREVKDIKDIKNVATISSESEEVGSLIAEVIEKAGKTTPIYIEDNTMANKTDFVIVNGLETQAGYISSSDPVIEMEDVFVFATDKKINTLIEIKTVLEVFDSLKITSPIILCPDIEESVFKTFMKGKEAGLFNYVIIRAKGAELVDMASASGATLISTTTGLEFKDVKAEHLGKVKKIIATDRKTTIIADNSEIRTKAVENLVGKAQATTNIYEKQMYTKRAEALKGGVAIIRVGAPTDTERNDLKLKILNAVNATKSAIEGGIVEGGGMCLYRAANQIKGGSVGEKILRHALKAPLKNIVQNAGEDYAEVVKKIKNKKGYNASTNAIKDLFKEGIIDSAKATRCALMNAISSAGEFITVQTIITKQK